MKGKLKYLITGIIVLIAVIVVALRHWDYIFNPWTRDGQVRAQVIQITPRVSGPIIKLPIKDNQFVKAGDLLFEIDARTFEADLEQARAELDVTCDNIEALAKQVAAAQADVEAASATIKELNLEFTQKKAPVDGYVTNLNLRLGSQAVENQAILALVDVNSYWVTGFFKENYIEGIRKGDRAILTLMSYRDKPLEGRVDSLGQGITQDDGSTGFDMLPTISATFEWIRPAQRVPVRIHLAKIQKGVELRVGTTVSVLVMRGTSGSESKKAAVAAPLALQ